MGIANKCFEILENKRDWVGRPDSHLGMQGIMGEGVGSDEEEEEEEEEEDAEGDEDEADDEGEAEPVDDTESDEEGDDEDTDSEAESGDRHTARLRLREILFYDDKVAVFKARHGRL